MPLNGRAMTSVCIGTLFVWSGIRGWSLLGTLGDLITGKAPTQTGFTPLTNPNASPSDGTSPVSGSGDIAGTALQYQGHAYSFGGAPGNDGSRAWDCSSFVNFVVGVKLRYAIPGFGAGNYDGSSHGPPTGVWGIWSGLSHVSRGDVQAGDIIVWLDHMGIAISNTQMISALNPAQGTRISAIEGYGNGPILCYGRYGRIANGPVKFN